MYFVAFKTVNIFHLIFVFIFLIQLLSPNIIKNICRLIIFIFNIVFLLEYIMDLLKVYKLEEFQKNIKKIQFYLVYNDSLSDTSVEIFIYGIIYCFYIQYQLYNNKLYQQLTLDKNINLAKFIDIKLKNIVILKKILYFIGNIILELYKWVIICLFVIFVCYFEISFLFSIKLFLFLLSVYQFIIFIQKYEKGTGKMGLFLCRFVLIFSGLNTLLVFIYQILCLDYLEIKTKLQNIDSFYIKNLSNFGLTIYNSDKLYYKLFPHFFSNFLLLLYITEMKRISEVYGNLAENLKKNRKIKNTNQDEEEITSENAKIKYKNNKKRMKILNLKYILESIIIYFTKLYWLILFMTVCIIYTCEDLSAGLLIYIIIFGFTFISTFKKIIKNLENFINKKSFFISKVIRYSIIEKKQHIEQNKYHRSISFQCLLGYSFILFYLIYFYGVFDLFQHGCNPDLFKDCDNSHEPIIPVDEPDGEHQNLEALTASISYFFGFYINLRKNGIMTAAWSHLILSILIAFDVYIQKLENYLVLKSLKNRKEYKKLSNENVKLKPLIYLENEEKINKEEKNNANDENDESLIKSSTIIKCASSLSSYINENEFDNLFEDIKKSFKKKKIKISEEDENQGRQYIIQFIGALKKATYKHITLSSSSKKFRIIKGIKSIVEELIIFLLICTAISKLSIWSFIYLLISINLIINPKTMKTYYNVFCFIIFAVFFQCIIFLSNIQEDTDPTPDKDILIIIKERLGIPWYTSDLKNGFFFGLGVSRSQINLIWMDFIEIIIIYIYLDYFSYSIYQDVCNKGSFREGNNKINYYNLNLNKNVNKCVKSLTQKKFFKVHGCMKYNFDIDIGNFHEFRNRILLNVISLRNIKNNTINNENKSQKIIIHSPVSSDKMKETIKEGMSSLTEIIYLSSHIIILIIIIILSMMISGLFSLFYIILSLQFLSSSYKMYLGEKYYYPKAIRKLFRVVIIGDIAFQILYQMPYINSNIPEDSIVFKILELIGFNKIIDFGDGTNVENFIISSEEMIIVIAKAIIYFFMSIQILIYSSQSFQEHYLSYLITKNENFGKKALMNVFKFNNKRLKTMDNAIKLREETPKLINSLQNILENWNNKLSLIDGHGNNQKKLSSCFNSNITDINQNNDDNENKEKYIEQKEDKKEEMAKNEDFFKLIKSDLNKKTEEEYVPEKKIKELIKQWIFDKFLIKIQQFIHRHSTSYTHISEEERDNYERDIIQGKIKVVSFLEKIIDLNLNTLDLAHFSKSELPELKKFFDGSKKVHIENFPKEGERSNSQTQEKIKKNNTSSDNNELVELENILKDNTVSLNKEKFIEIERFTVTELFTKYLKTLYLFKLMSFDLLSLIYKNFSWLCYLIMIVNHMRTSSLISLFYPLSIFCYAIFEYPRPPKRYWNICLTYAIITLAIKFIVQLFVNKDIINKIKENNTFNNIIDNLKQYKVGLIRTESTFSYEFFNYIFYDSLVIIFILFNDYLLIKKGLWGKRSQELENIYQAIERVSKSKKIKLENPIEVKAFNRKYLKLNKKQKLSNNKNKDIKIENTKNSNNEKNMLDTFKEKYKAEGKTYYQRLFPKIRNEKPGGDYYLVYTITMVLITVYIVLFYTTMVQDVTFDYLSEVTKQFSGSMIVFLFFHVIILFYDRVIYTSQNRYDLQYDYIFYDKKTNEPITEKEFSNIKSDITSKYSEVKKEHFAIPFEYIEILKSKYDIVFIQNEKFNIPLLQKYILQLFLVIFSHIIIFFYFPMKGNLNLNGTLSCEDINESCNDFPQSPALIFFYCLYVIYFISSGLQIKYGFYDMKRKSLLKSGNKSVNGIINKIFKSIPFLYEIKLAIDWTFTSTCLDFFQWNKFENAYDVLYTTYCAMIQKNQQLVGKEIGIVLKTGMGGTFSFALLLLLVLPILLFSTLNPANILNNLTGATLQIDLSFFYKSGSIQNYTLFQNSKPESIDEYKYNEKEWERYKYNESVQMQNFPTSQIQKVHFFTASDKNWGLAQPHINSLIDILNITENETDIKKIQLVIDYEFQRPLPAEARTAYNRRGKVIFDINKNKTIEKNSALGQIKEAISECSSKTVLFSKFYSSLLRLTANTNVKLVEDYSIKSDIYLGFTGCKKENNVSNYLEAYFTLSQDNKTDEGLFFYVLSDKVSSTVSGYSILSFYVSFVLIAGNYIRNFFAGEPQKIFLTEMPQLKEIIKLCEGVKVSRYSYDFEQEEKLYYILIELLRSPDYLRLLTDSSTSQFLSRKEMTKLKEKQKI